MEIIIFILIAFFVVFIVAPGVGAILTLIMMLFGAGASRGNAGNNSPKEESNDL